MTTFPLRTGRLAAGLSLALLSGCMVAVSALPTVTGSGVAKTENRTVGDFTEVEVGNAIHLDLTVGPSRTVEVTADDNLLPHVVTEVAGGRLKIYADAGTATKIGIKVKATTPTLKAVEGSGASTATVTGVQADRFRLGLSGASTCTLTGKADRLDVTVSGASRCTLTGDAGRLTAECSGASHLDATGLSAKTVDASASGASTADVKAAEELKADASGASNVHYVGSPGKLSKSTSGASHVGPK
jgi:Putative auto-transporter adhesin, head GIN domain